MEKILIDKNSISKRIYSFLVYLYPPSFVQKHGPELLQNFEELERDAGSEVTLWAFIISDLITSLSHQYMEYIKNNRWLQFVLIAFLMLAALFFWQTVKLNRAHSTFDYYAAFRGCKVITSRTDTDGTCRLENGQSIKIVKYDDRWFLDGDTPVCALQIGSFCPFNWP